MSTLAMIESKNNLNIKKVEVTKKLFNIIIKFSLAYNLETSRLTFFLVQINLKLNHARFFLTSLSRFYRSIKIWMTSKKYHLNFDWINKINIILII